MDAELSGTWLPSACTLPTARRPARMAELDQLFGRVRTVDRPEPTRLRCELEPTESVAAMAARWSARETGCCSFFTFTLTATGGRLTWEVSVPFVHVEVLDALARRATAAP